MVTDAQVRLLRKRMSEGKTMISAAASAGMSERSAQRWKAGTELYAASTVDNGTALDDQFEAHRRGIRNAAVASAWTVYLRSRSTMATP